MASTDSLRRSPTRPAAPLLASKRCPAWARGLTQMDRSFLRDEIHHDLFAPAPHGVSAFALRAMRNSPRGMRSAGRWKRLHRRRGLVGRAGGTRQGVAMARHRSGRVRAARISQTRLGLLLAPFKTLPRCRAEVHTEFVEQSVRSTSRPPTRCNFSPLRSSSTTVPVTPYISSMRAGCWSRSPMTLARSAWVIERSSAAPEQAQPRTGRAVELRLVGVVCRLCPASILRFHAQAYLAKFPIYARP